MEYADVARFSGSFGLLYMIAIFAVACVYALWPKNRTKFERAARIPLNEGPLSDEPPPERREGRP